MRCGRYHRSTLCERSHDSTSTRTASFAEWTSSYLLAVVCVLELRVFHETLAPGMDRSDMSGIVMNAGVRKSSLSTCVALYKPCRCRRKRSNNFTGLVEDLRQREPQALVPRAKARNRSKTRP